jgi:hypothetical protein
MKHGIHSKCPRMNLEAQFGWTLDRFPCELWPPPLFKSAALMKHGEDDLPLLRPLVEGNYASRY